MKSPLAKIQKAATVEVSRSANAEDQEKAKEEKEFYDRSALAYRNGKYTLKLWALQESIKARKRYATMIFWLIVFWLALVLAIIIMDGFGKIGTAEFNVPNSIMITLITTTTANIAAFFTIVIRYIFPINKRPKAE